LQTKVDAWGWGGGTKFATSRALGHRDGRQHN